MRKYVNNVISCVSIIVSLLIILIIIRAICDLFTTGHLFWVRYFYLFVQNTLGAIIFFALIELIDYFWQRHRTTKK